MGHLEDILDRLNEQQRESAFALRSRSRSWPAPAPGRPRRSRTGSRGRWTPAGEPRQPARAASPFQPRKRPARPGEPRARWAIEERYYGRVARTLYVGVLSRPEDKQVAAAINGLAQAAAESVPANAADELRCTLSHARIPIEEVRTFWAQVQEIARTFAQIPRAGDQVYGFVAGLYPTDAPTLPDRDGGPTD